MSEKRHKTMGVEKFKRGAPQRGSGCMILNEQLGGRVVEYPPPPAVRLPVADYHCRGVANPVFDDD